MYLYIFITIILFATLLLGTRREALEVATIPTAEQSADARTYKLLGNILTLCILVVLWGLTAFRAPEIGNDTKVYIDYYNEINFYGVNTNYQIEIGYQYLSLLLGKISTDPMLLIFVTSTICYLGAGIYIFAFSKNVPVSLCILFCISFSVFTNTIRQAIAMVFILYAYQLLKHKQYFWSFIVMLIASTFHVSAFVFIIFYFYLLIPTHPIAVAVMIAVLAGLTISGLLKEILIRILPDYTNYLDSQYASSGWLAVSFEMARNAVMYFFAYLAFRDNKKKFKLPLVNFTILLVMTCLGYTMNLFTRATQYFMMIAVVEFPNAMYEKNFKWRNLWLIAFVGVLLLYFIAAVILRPEWNYLYPYRFRFSPKW